MVKYDEEFKMKVVIDYLKGYDGYQYLANKYQIKNKSQVEHWIRTYKEFGESGLRRSQINKSYSVQFKLDAIELYETSGKSYREISNGLGITNYSLLAGWVKKFRENGIQGLSSKKGRPTNMPKKTNKSAAYPANQTDQERIEELEKRVRSLEIQNAYLKELRKLRKMEAQQQMKHLRKSSIASEDKFKLVELLTELEFPKATYMYWQKRFEMDNPKKELEEEITSIFYEHEERYGYRRITNELKTRGRTVNHKKVLRIMKKLGLKVIKFMRKSRKYSSYKGKVGLIAKNRIHRKFYTSIPHQKITTDTTEFKYYEKNNGILTVKKLYLDPYLDMFNSEIISYAISNHPNAKSIEQAQLAAIERTSDCPYRRTFHSDQGWAYQMKNYSKCLKDNKIFQSMSRKGNCLDNSLMENFFGLLKQEMYYGKVFHSFEELKEAIEKWIHYYNHKRIKVKLDGLSPVAYRLKLAA
ncbi:IS3 family transposase [Vagococcus zengguangii]|uniref:IS3 family transposase n=2 Tax=Vagococcus zengguangii TaxID=2571750 RepID=A0A4D7CN69_9ENTE|nr:IS3 family transposase [Vagococcus zengguangii]TLG78260.1 IS3 family transposase [Vagococcus zengguangii]